MNKTDALDACPQCGSQVKCAFQNPLCNDIRHHSWHDSVQFENVAATEAEPSAPLFKCPACPHETYDFVAAQEHAGSHAGDPVSINWTTNAAGHEGKSVREEIARLTRLVSVLQEGKDTWRRAATADYAKLVEAEAELEKVRGELAEARK